MHTASNMKKIPALTSAQLPTAWQDRMQAQEAFSYA
jgi:hypothetical protein